MIWILLFSFAFGKPAPKPSPSRGEQILNQPAKTSLLGAGPALPLIRSTIEKQNSFVRAEFDRPELREKLTREVGETIHQLAPLTGSTIAAWLRSDAEVWWVYLEALSYDEGTKTALDFSWKARQDLFSGLRKKALELQPQFPTVEALAWLKKMRFQPPLDRLLLAEAKKRDSQAFRLVGLVQNNPFRSIRQYREKLPAILQKSDSSELDRLWTDQDAQRLREFSEQRDELVKFLETYPKTLPAQ